MWILIKLLIFNLIKLSSDKCVNVHVYTSYIFISRE